MLTIGINTLLGRRMRKAYVAPNLFIGSIKGNAAAWNQNISSISGYGVTSSNAEYTVTSAGGNNANRNCRINDKTTSECIIGHKYYVTCEYKATTKISLGVYVDSSVSLAATENFTRITKLFTANYPPRQWFVEFVGTSTSSDTAVFRKMQITDLSLLSTSLAATTGLDAAMVERWLKKNVGLIPYYAQNNGTLLGATIRGLRAPKTANLLDPVGKSALLFSYSYSEGGTTITNGYTIKQLPSDAALTFTPAATGVAEAITPDASGHFSVSGIGVLNVVNAEGGGAYSGSGDLASVWLVATYDGALDDYSNFRPYAVNELTIDSRCIYYDDNGTKRKVWEDGIIKATGQSADDVADVLRPNTDTGRWEAEVNVIDINLGEITGWNGVYAPLYYKDGFTDIQPPADTNTKPNIICSKYPTRRYIDTNSSSNYNKIISCSNNGGGRIAIKDTQYVSESVAAVHAWFERKNKQQHTTLYYSNDGVTFEEMTLARFPAGLHAGSHTEVEVLKSQAVDNDPTSLYPIIEYQE